MYAFAPLFAAAPVLAGAPLPSRLTLDDALKIFSTRGFDLLLADAQVDLARADRRAAASVPNPGIGGTVGTSFGYDATQCPGCSAIAWSVSVSDNSALMDSLSGRRGLRMRVADAALRAARLSRDDARRVLEFQLVQQYLQAVLARDTLDFAHEVQGALAQMLQLTEVRFKAGAISETDVAKIETAKLEADQDVERATQDLEAGKTAIAFLLGVRGLRPDFHIEQDLPKFEVPPALQRVTPEQLLEIAHRNRPDLRAVEAQKERAGLSVSAARRLRVPDMALSAQFAAEGSGQQALQPPTLTFGLTVTPPLFYQFQGEVRRAEADARTQSILADKVEAQVANDVSSAWAAFSGTRTRLERMESGLLGSARRALDLVDVQYKKGAASLLEFLDAQRQFIATNLEYLRDLADYWTAVFQLEQAVGARLRA